MGIEDQTMNRRTLLKFGLVSAAGLILRCGGDASVNIPPKIDIGTEDVGNIWGTVEGPAIEKNKVVYKPITGIEVILQDTDFRILTDSRGEYKLNDVPAKTQIIIVNENPLAQRHNGWHSEKRNISVGENYTHQEDFRLRYNGMGEFSGILAGIATWNNGRIYNGEINFHNGAWDGEKYVPGTKLSSTKTTPYGEFAFYFTQNPCFLLSPEGETKVEGSPKNTGFINLTYKKGIFKKNLIITPKN